MSLIHDALKQMDRPGTPDATHAETDVKGFPLAPVARRRNGFVPVVIAFVAVVAAGGVAYAGWKMTGNAPTASTVAVAPAAPATAVALPVVATLSPTPTPALVSAPLPTPAPDVVVVAVAEVPVPAAVTLPAVPSPAVSSSTAMPALPVPKAPSMAAVVPTKAAPARVAAPAPVRSRPVEVKAAKVVDTATPAVPRAAVVASAADPVSSEQHFSLFLEAMRIKNTAAAESQLVALRRQLTRSSISLVRAEAWFAYSRGDTVTARREYQEVIERLPGDEEASINLASIEAAQKQTELARQILSDALRVNPESETLKSTLAAFGGRR